MASLYWETKAVADQALREYEANCETAKRLLDKILACDNLASAKEIAFEAKEVLHHGL